MIKNKKSRGIGGIEIPPIHKSGIKTDNTPKKQTSSIVKLLLGFAAVKILYNCTNKNNM